MATRTRKPNYKPVVCDCGHDCLSHHSFEPARPTGLGFYNRDGCIITVGTVATGLRPCPCKKTRLQVRA